MYNHFSVYIRINKQVHKIHTPVNATSGQVTRFYLVAVPGKLTLIASDSGKDLTLAGWFRIHRIFHKKFQKIFSNERLYGLVLMNKYWFFT